MAEQSIAQAINLEGKYVEGVIPDIVKKKKKKKKIEELHKTQFRLQKKFEYVLNS